MMADVNILIIEDDEDIQELLRYNLVKQGYQVAVAATGELGLREAEKSCPDLILLDLMLPGMDGLDVCRRLKMDEKTRPIPVVMVTAKGEETDIVTGLELGADDYVVKPFSPRVLISRMRAVLRRSEGAAAGVDEAGLLNIHELAIHPGRHEVRVDGKAVDLSATEFSILHYLARRKGWVFTRNQIVTAVHGPDYPVTDRSVDVQIVGLRKKLGGAGRHIETVRGVGYRFAE